MVGGAALVIGRTSKLATLIRLPENFSMMFDHPMGEPLGSYRKRSRVESAKRLWRVSRTVPPVSVCEVEVILDLSDARSIWRDTKTAENEPLEADVKTSTLKLLD